MQTTTWNVTAGAEEIVLVAAPGPNGKVLLRANGRMVTSPIAPEELEREFAFAGTRFRVVRDGDALQIESLGEDVPFVPEPEPTLPVLQTRWLGAAFLVAAAVATVVFLFLELCLALSIAEVHRSVDVRMILATRPRLFLPLRVGLFGAALTLAITGFMALRTPAAVLQKTLTAVPWIVVGAIVPVAIFTDRTLHRVANEHFASLPAGEVLHNVHVFGVAGLLSLAVAAGAALYCAATRPPLVVK